ncbi:ABC-type nitrate/sulfonate/bicarbonate transport system substrate-binding protein [Bradyrhizobium sp. LM6.10]
MSLPSAVFHRQNPETVQRLVNALLKTHRWINATPTEQLVDTIPPGYKTDNRKVNIEIMNASKALFSPTGQMDVEAAKVPLAVLSDFDPKIAAARIDLNETFTNRFAERAAQELK